MSNPVAPITHHWLDSTHISFGVITFLHVTLGEMAPKTMAILRAERFALDHHGLDYEFWARMRTHYTDREVVELSMCLGSWIAFGRLNRVLGLDEACVLPSHLSSR